MLSKHTQRKHRILLPFPGLFSEKMPLESRGSPYRKSSIKILSYKINNYNILKKELFGVFNSADKTGLYFIAIFIQHKATGNRKNTVLNTTANYALFAGLLILSTKDAAYRRISSFDWMVWVPSKTFFRSLSGRAINAAIASWFCASAIPNPIGISGPFT
jgi:hypothetical protein